LTLAEAQERLVAWGSAESRQGWILAARREHFARHGEPHEEDPSFEARMNGLLDFFAFDFRPDGASTTLELFLRDGAADVAAEDRASLVDLALGVHALFEVRRVRAGEVRVRDVFSGEEHDVSERRAAAGLEKGDLIEARLLPWEGRLHFSPAFLFHPRPLRKRILDEVKRRLRAAGKGAKPDVEDFLALLARMALRLERYRNARAESIYDFDAPPPVRSGPWD
jgi:hypothetical protein